jgi:hypothetical protein
VDIKMAGSSDSNLNFYDQVVRVEKGWVEQEFVLFIHFCIIAAWSRVAKWDIYSTEYPLMKIILPLASKLSSFQKVYKVTTWVRLTVLSYNRACRDSPLVRIPEPISCRVQTGNWKYRALCLKLKNLESNVYNWKT